MTSLRVFKGRFYIMTILLLISSVLVLDDIPVLLANPPMIDGCDVLPSIPSSGSLRHERDGSMEKYDSKVNAKDFIAEVAFYNPYSSTEGDWDYGFLFRSQDDTFHAIRVTSSKEWFHYLAIGGKWWKIGGGGGYGLRTGSSDKNRLCIIVLGEKGFFYLNGKFVASLDTSRLIQEGDVSVFINRCRSSNLGFQGCFFTNFAIWSFDSCSKPHSDEDSDGVPDIQDNCINLGCTIVDSSGCPRDTDEDGVIDCNDDCPSEYGEEKNGCPFSASPQIEEPLQAEKPVSRMDSPLINWLYIISAVISILAGIATLSRRRKRKIGNKAKQDRKKKNPVQ